MNKDKIILKFEAEWCNPCKILTKMINTEENKFDGIDVRVINIDDQDNFDLVETHQVKSIPTLVFINNGEVFDRLSGLPTRSDLIFKLQKFKNA